MARHHRKAGVLSGKVNRPCRIVSSCVIAAFLAKLANHLVVLACLAILGQATGRLSAGRFSIFLLVVAALAHGVGQTLKPRLHKAIYPGRDGP